MNVTQREMIERLDYNTRDELTADRAQTIIDYIASMPPTIHDINGERERQITLEGWSAVRTTTINTWRDHWRYARSGR
jgi:hypothetical protein